MPHIIRVYQTKYITVPHVKKVTPNHDKRVKITSIVLFSQELAYHIVHLRSHWGEDYIFLPWQVAVIW